MLPEDITILHPATYDLRALAVQTYNRSIVANDLVQYLALRSILTTCVSKSAVASSLDPATDLTSADMAHVQRYFTDECQYTVYRSALLSEGGPDIKADIIAIHAAIASATPPPGDIPLNALVDSLTGDVLIDSLTLDILTES